MWSNDNSDVNRQKFLPVFSAPDILHSSLVCYLEKTYRTVEEKVHEDKIFFGEEWNFVFNHIMFQNFFGDITLILCKVKNGSLILCRKSVFL